MPVIGISPCSKLHDYEESVRRAGGELRLLDYAADSPADIVRAVDGLVLPGGDDVLPSIYGEAAHATFVAAEAGRDEFELELVRRALAANLPILAICRGLQILNVACGGTLVQDLPSEVPNALPHTVAKPPVAIAHDVWMVPGSLLDRLMRPVTEAEECPVNSRHHQAVKAVGEGLVVSATAPDGVVEAIEAPAQRFCLGVQWHPENFYRTGEFRPLFEGFVEAAGKRG